MSLNDDLESVWKSVYKIIFDKPVSWENEEDCDEFYSDYLRSGRDLNLGPPE